MIENLISTGEGLAAKVVSGGRGRMISGIEFETWAANTIFFLEEEFPKSSITEKAIQKNKTLNVDSHGNYEFLLGTLFAAKTMLEERARKDREKADFFRNLNS